MNKLQQRLLDMLKWYHQFCDLYHLRYYAIGGTTLGAIRHDGFIPWDDDIDVGMPRPDYERFKKLAKEKINNKSVYFAEFPLDNKDFVYQFCKLYDQRTTLIENTRFKMVRGIYLDIFPLDGIGNEECEIKKRAREIILLNQILYTRVCALNRNRNIYRNLAIVISRLIPEPFLSYEKLIRSIERICKESEYEKSKYVGHIINMISPQHIIKRSFFGTPVLHCFEDTQIYVQEHAEEYLKSYFGDWEVLPPPDQQISFHDFLYLNFDEPYTEKMRGN